jgi:hypothetical protein
MSIIIITNYYKFILILTIYNNRIFFFNESRRGVFLKGQ